LYLLNCGVETWLGEEVESYTGYNIKMENEPAY